MSIEEIENEIVDEFAMFEDAMEKYEYIIDLGNELPEFDEHYRMDDLLVKGCQSKVWLYASEADGRVHFMVDSNTAITKGLIALLVRVLDGQRPQDIVAAKLGFIERIGLRSHLSSQRSNGLTAMIGQMKGYAKRVLQQETGDA